MYRRFARLAVIGGICVACWMVSCSVDVGPTGVRASLSLAGRTVSLTFGPGGLSLEVTANTTTAPKAVGFRLFDQTPAQVPSTGSVILRSTDVGVGRVLNAKEVVQAQGVPASGTATIRFYVAAGQSAAVCDAATLMAEFNVTFNAGAGSVANEIYELSQAALQEIAQNDVVICVEVTADFDGEIVLFNFSLSFGGGNPNTALFSLRNYDDNENIHILLPGETFDPANRLTPNTSREASLSGVEKGDYITVQAGRNGVVLDDVSCPIVQGSNYTAIVEWDGFSLTCSADQVSTGGPPVAPTGTELQIPIDAYGNAAEPTATYNGVDYAVIGVLDVNSSTDYPPNLPSNITSSLGKVDVNLADLGLQYVERIDFSSHAAWVPDLPNGIVIATLTCDYVEGGLPTTLNFTLGSTTAEWSYDRPDHEITFGGVPHDIIPILYSFPTVSVMGYEYDGHVYSGSLELDTSRTLSSITLELGNIDDFVNNRITTDSPVPTWAGQGMLAITLIGPAGTPQAGGGGGGGGGGGTGIVTGQVVDAQTGAGLAGVLIEVGGTGLSVLTDGSGNFTLNDVPEGGQTLQATLTGYVETTVPVVTITEATTETSIGMLAIGAGGDNVAVVLAWGQNPRDLDLHMSGPDGSGGRFHAYFSNKAPFPHVFLDLDDTDSFGPETMTVKPGESGNYVAGDYHVWVHHYAGDLTFGDSAATITLFAGGAQIAQYSVGDASGDSTKRIWQVVEFTVSETGAVSNITVIQSFTDGDSSSEF